MMRKHLPWIFLVLFGAYLLASLKLPRRSQGPDLIGFAGLPALQGGRLKPLDTIARSSLLMLSGKRTLVRNGERMSAIQWMLEAMARPEAADGTEVFAIQDPDLLGLLGGERGRGKHFAFKDLEPFLGELEAQAAQAEKVEAQLRTRFQAAALNLWDRVLLYQRLRNTLQVAPTEDFLEEIGAYEKSLGPGMKAFHAHRNSSRFDRKSLATLGHFFERYQFLSRMAYFRPLVPGNAASPEWMDVGEGLLLALRTGGIHPHVPAYAHLLRSYRKNRPAVFNNALTDYRKELRERVPRAASLADYELLFNHLEPFYKGMVLYLAALLLVFLSWVVWPEVFRRSAFTLLFLAFGVHTAGLVFRILLQGRPPVTNLYSSAVFVGWVAVLLGIFLERISRRGFGSLVAAATGFCTLIIAHHLTAQGDTMEMMRAVLDSNFWLATHVVTITIGYGGTFLAGALAHIAIFRRLGAASPDAESSRVLEGMTYGVVCFSLFFSFVGTVLGGIWADQSWGRFWGWDPKENGALLIVLWNAIILHARWGKYVGDRGLMVMAVFGNIVTSLSWFGVNMLGIGLHSYGFMDKAFFWLAAFVVSQIFVMLLAAFPRSSAAHEG